MSTHGGSQAHPDPRIGDHLANERTFLAWIRTSISVIVFGFVVAKFGITLRQFLRIQGATTQEGGFSVALGVAFMAIGVGMSLVATRRYRTNRLSLEAGGFKPADT